MRYGTASANADCVFRDYQGWRQLLAFEFIRGTFNFVQNPINTFRVVTCCDDFCRRCLLLEIELQNRVHYFVRRKAVLVELVRRELGGRPLLDYPRRDYLSARFFVDMASKLPDFRF